MKFGLFSMNSYACSYPEKDLGELEISVTPRIPLTQEIVQRFADLGVHRLIIMPPSHLSESQLEDFVSSIGEMSI